MVTSEFLYMALVINQSVTNETHTMSLHLTQSLHCQTHTHTHTQTQPHQHTPHTPHHTNHQTHTHRHTHTHTRNGAVSYPPSPSKQTRRRPCESGAFRVMKLAHQRSIQSGCFLYSVSRD